MKRETKMAKYMIYSSEGSKFKTALCQQIFDETALQDDYES
jgi:hypothetical protein